MIDSSELKKLQKLTKLTITEQEIANFSTKLDNVLSMIGKLHQIECDNVEPLRSVCELNQRTRPDEITTPDLSEDLFRNIPSNGAQFAREIKCFVVPKVVE